MIIGGIIQWETEIPLQAVDGDQHLRQPLLRHRIAQDRPGLGIQVQLAACALLRSNFTTLMQRTAIPVAIPGGSIQCRFEFFVLPAQPCCEIVFSNLPENRLQHCKGQAGLLRQHHGFRVWIGGHVQRVVPVREPDAAEPMRAFVRNQPIGGSLQMLQHGSLAAVLPGKNGFQHKQITGLLNQMTHRPDEPEGLIRIMGIVIGVPGQYGVAVFKLMLQALQNFFLCFLRPEGQERHGDLQVVPHTLFAHNAEINLLLYPEVHHLVDMLVWRMYRERAVFPQHACFSRLTGFLCVTGCAVGIDHLSSFLRAFRHAQHKDDLFCLAGLQRQLVLQDCSRYKQCRLRDRAVLTADYNFWPLEKRLH